MRKACFLFMLAACTREPPWTMADVSSKMTSAGWTVSPAKSPGIPGAGIARVDCIDASRSGATDTLCVVQCNTRGACSSFTTSTWESYGMFQRGRTVLVHQVCGRPTGYALSFDCTAARRALGIL